MANAGVSLSAANEGDRRDSRDHNHNRKRRFRKIAEIAAVCGAVEIAGLVPTCGGYCTVAVRSGTGLEETAVFGDA